MKPLVSILISVKDQLSLTKKCIGCVEKSLKSSISYEVLIANDASVDGTEKYLESLPSRLSGLSPDRLQSWICQK